MTLSLVERGQFLKLFNRGGYVLNFATADFDSFAASCVGLCPVSKYSKEKGYPLSKGKALIAYCEDDATSDEDVLRLFLSLLDYYEFHYKAEYDESESVGGHGSRYDEEYARLYQACRAVADREKGRDANPFTATANKLKEAFSTDYMVMQIDLLMKMRDENPTVAIGKSKELMECCCKTILEKQGGEIQAGWDVPRLVKETMSLLRLNVSDLEHSPENTVVKKILGSLSGLATGIAEYRNKWGDGHGRSASFEPLFKRHAKLAVGSSITFVEYLWETYEWRRSQGQLK